MKVPESNPANASNVVAVHNRASEYTAKVPSGRSLGGTDAVEVSSLSMRLTKLSEQHSEAQASRLKELSNVVSTGRYRVDAQAVSQKMIQEHLRPAA